MDFSVFVSSVWIVHRALRKLRRIDNICWRLFASDERSFFLSASSSSFSRCFYSEKFHVVVFALSRSTECKQTIFVAAIKRVAHFFHSLVFCFYFIFVPSTTILFNLSVLSWFAPFYGYVNHRPSFDADSHRSNRTDASIKCLSSFDSWSRQWNQCVCIQLLSSSLCHWFQYFSYSLKKSFVFETSKNESKRNQQNRITFQL